MINMPRVLMDKVDCMQEQMDDVGREVEILKERRETETLSHK